MLDPWAPVYDWFRAAERSREIHWYTIKGNGEWPCRMEHKPSGVAITAPTLIRAIDAMYAWLGHG